MTDQNQQDLELKNSLLKALEKIVIPFAFGSIKIQIREGKPTLFIMERTVKLD